MPATVGEFLRRPRQPDHARPAVSLHVRLTCSRGRGITWHEFSTIDAGFRGEQMASED